MTTELTTAAERNRAAFERYHASEHSDVSMMAPDAVFTVMANGQEAHGPEAILGLLTYFYHVAFDAHAEMKTLVIDDQHAFGEWDFVGRHIGDFNGIPATGRDVRVPLAVAYDFADGRITAGRIYFEIPSLLAQLGVA